MKITNQTKNTVIGEKVVIADSFWARMKGLLGRDSLDPGEVLVIHHCNSIHMFFMRFAIDVIFVDDDLKVVGCVKNIRPFRLSPIFFKSRHAVEAAVGTIEKSETQNGDQLRME